MATKLSFDVTVDVDGKLAAAHIDELKAQLEELKNKRIALEIDGGEAKVKIREIKDQLTELQNKHPNIDVRVDAARATAQLAAIRDMSDRMERKELRIDVDDGGSAENSKSKLNLLLGAGLALGPGIIPVAAAVAAAVAAIGTGAVVGVAALGTIKLAFANVGGAVTELETAQNKGASTAATTAAQQISSANSITSAQESLANAVQNVGVTQAAAALSVRHAQEQVVSATLAVRSALEQQVSAHLGVQHAIEQETTAHQGLDSALIREADSEVSLVDSQRAALRAQVDLTQARVDAQRALQDMAFSVADNALAQQRAQLDLQAAQAALSNVAVTDPRRAGAELSLAEQQQHIAELQTQGQRLADDKKQADAQGVEGSRAVTSATDALSNANRQVVTAQQAVHDSAIAVTQAQQGVRDSIIAVTRAQQSERDSIDAVTQARVREQDAIDAVGLAQSTGARQVQSAQQAVTSATRALESAQAQATAQTAAQAAATDVLTESYDKLSPAGKAFAHFVHDELEPALQGLQNTAQEGLLPGVEAGLKAAMPILPEVRGLISDVATALGDMATRTGEALNNPFWHGFIAYIDGEAGPSLHTFGIVMGNLATGGAAILMAFKPVWDQMGAGVAGWSAKFAEASKTLSTNPAFQNFLAFVKENGPLVVHAVEALAVAAVKVGQALAPWGVAGLGVLDTTASLIALLPQGVLDWLAPTILAITFATKVMGLTMAITTVATEATTFSVLGLNVALTANPIGLVIVALTLLALGFQYAWTHSETFRAIVIAAWQGIQWAAEGTWNFLRDLFDRFMAGIHQIGQVFSDVSGWIRDTWGSIRDYARAPIQFVIDVVYNNGILPVWNGIADVFGLHRLNPVHLATGGVLPGYAPGRDTVPAMLSPGEGILVPEAVQGLGPDFVHWANRAYSGGRVTGGMGYADGGIIGDITGMFTDPLGSLRKSFSGVFDSATRIPGVGMLTEAMKNLPGKMIDGAVEKIKGLIQSAASAIIGSAGAGVERWRGVGLAALSIAGQDPSNIGRLLMQMGTESGGNPTAVNLLDINAQRGTPSYGLMQVIGPTYARWHHPAFNAPPFAYGVSADPMSNILASIRYTLGAYGSLAAGWQGHGYADGGIVTSPTVAKLGESGPEVVLPLTRPGRAQSLLQQTGMGATTVNVGPVYVSNDVDVDQLAHRLSFASTAAGF